LPLRPKKFIASLKTVPHGGLDAAEMERLGIDPAGVLDFSVSTNPFMPPPGVREILRSLPVERYPDSSSKLLRRKLAARLGVSPENIVAGNGTTELIRLLALAYLRRGDTTLVLEPTYGEYGAAVRLAGARAFGCRASEDADFAPDIPGVADLVRKNHPRAVFVCNPNNPTGRYLARREIETILESLGEGLLVLDEAYVAFVEKGWDSLPLTERGNVVVLRSMTKDYGLPGLRLGYAVARRDIADGLRAALPPWNVNIAAQEVGAAVLAEDAFLERSMLQLRKAASFLVAGLGRLGLTVLPSDTHYFLLKVGNAAACRLSLLRDGCLVRDASSFDLSAYVRVAARSIPECRKLIDAFARFLQSDQAAGRAASQDRKHGAGRKR
jgi:histidinol-phosphate aminotransferase